MQPQGTLFSRAAPDSHVFLVPDLDRGHAGWCMATSTRSAGGGGDGCSAPNTSTGPVFAAGCDGDGETSTDLYALTTSEVAAVSVDGGTPVSTSANPTLPDGLRAVAVELFERTEPRPDHFVPCATVTPLGANGMPIRRRGVRGAPLEVRLPTSSWEPPAHSSRGACHLDASELPHGTAVYDGEVTSGITPLRGLLGKALLSCAQTTFIYNEEHHLPSAVLLDAAHPGAMPLPLPGMTPVLGHPGVFEAPGPEERVARRIPGAWLVVEEEDEIGLRVPIELLQDLRATIRL
jgi:hypothetical protein